MLSIFMQNIDKYNFSEVICAFKEKGDKKPT